MISFKQYLEETPRNVGVEWTVKKLTGTEAASLVLSKCRGALDALMVNKALFRGFGSNLNGAAFIDTTNSLRASRDLSNLYQLAHDASVNTAHIPSRSNSLICSSDADGAESYADGVPHIVLPYDNYGVAVSDTSDFHSSNIKSWLFTGDVHSLDNFLQELLSWFGYKYANHHWDADDINKKLSAFSPEQFALTYVLAKTTQHDGNYAAKTLKRVRGISVDDFMDLIDSTDSFSSSDRQNAIKKLVVEIKKGNIAFSNKSAESIYNALVSMPKGKRFTAISSEIFQDGSNNVSVIFDMKKLPKKTTECWFAGKAVVVPMDAYSGKFFKQFLAELERRGIDIRKIREYGEY